VGGVQVVVEDTLGVCVALLVGVGAVGQLGGVGAQQVVQGVPAGVVFGEQTGPHQFGQQGAGLIHGKGGEAGRGGYADAGSGVQAEQPEQPGGGWGEGLVGPGEYGLDVGGGVVPGEHVPALPGVGQLIGQGV
jgi:hypothetical protein